MNRNTLHENMRRFGTKNLPLRESTLSDDDILDIILTYTKDPDKAQSALDSYRETGDFGDASIESNVTRDPRWTLTSIDLQDPTRAAAIRGIKKLTQNNTAASNFLNQKLSELGVNQLRDITTQQALDLNAQIIQKFGAPTQGSSYSTTMNPYDLGRGTGFAGSVYTGD